ncbi:MAG: helix-turn-helix domain-containing protein [Leadbetterella sp.]|jgi:transcriptional regulator with XRE-family HTH domain|nr:helix-turn-helix domain-containing protein [Leadbetterella sp.]
MTNYEFGVLIQNYRQKQKLSQTEFAAMFGVTQPTIAKWEFGKFGPSGSKRDELIQLVSVKIEEGNNDVKLLLEIIDDKKNIIDLLKDKIRGLDGSV